MSTVQQTLRKAKQLDERYKLMLAKRQQSERSMAQTFKKIDKAQQTLASTKQTIGSIDNLYQRLQKVLSDSIDNAVKSIEKSTLLTVAEPGFEPNHVQAKKVAQMLKDKKKVLILTGAGMSAASGIPTFRGEDGFWNKNQIQIDPEGPIEKIDPQIILTYAFYTQHPLKTWQWLRNFYHLKAKSRPNKGHLALAEIIESLRAKGKEVCIVTQNIDNLHIEAKMERLSKNKNMKDYHIHQIHGNILKLRCTYCSNKEKKLCYEPFESYLDIVEMKANIFCPRCQAPLRPHIMFFDQFYDEIFNHSDTVSSFLEGTDAMLVIGTTLSTGMANIIVTKAIEKQIQVVEINPTCQIKKSAVWWMQDKSQNVLQALKVQMIKK